MPLVKPKSKTKNRKWSRSLKRQIVDEYGVAPSRPAKTEILDRYQITHTHVRYWMMQKRQGKL
jgi:transposase-like protein